jgi:GAF domain-containing protein/CheY-like chemotaxis protein
MNDQPLRVLLVDDETSLREPLATYLRREHSYYVDTAASGKETLARIEGAQGQYDVALIDDLLMPTPDCEPEPLGIRLMTEIKACYPHIEFIIFTGWGMHSAIEALRAGAYRYIRKPFDIEELAVMIEHAAEYQRLKGVAREKQILEQLMQTSAALLRGRDLHDVLDTILRGVQTIGFDRVRLYLLSQDAQTMVGQAQVGLETEFIGLELPVAEDVYVQAMLADPRPRVFAREDNKPVPYEQKLAKEEINQWACVPLLLRGEVIGKLSADNKFSKRPITEAELEPIALFASQAAAAIENAHLIAREQEATQKAEQRARNLEAIQKVSTAISSLHELDEILDATCRAAVELFGVEHSGLVLFEPDKARGQVVAEYPDLGTRGLEIPVRGVPAEERLTTSQEPLIISDVPGEPSLGPVRDILGKFDIRSILIVPVMFKDRVSGSFSLDAIGHSRIFTEDDLELCKIFAAQVAVAVENAKLYESLEKQAERLTDLAVGLTGLYEIGKDMTSDLELDRILDSIAEHIVRVVGARRSLFIQVDTKRGRLIRATGHGYPPEHLQRLTYEEVEAGVSGWVLRTGEPILVTDAQSDPRNTGIALERAKQFETVPLIVAPLLVKGEVIGTLTAVNTGDDPPFAEEDLDLVVMLANQAAIAVENARLFEETRKGLACLRSVSEAGSVLISTLDPDQVLQIIVEQARQAVRAWRASVVLIGDDGRPCELAATGYEEAPKVSKIIRPTGISMQIVKTGLPRIIEDVPTCQAEVNPDMIRDGVGAAACFPLSLRGKNTGVMWIQYREPRAFSETEIEALSIYTKNAAIAFDNARRMRALEHMRRAAEALAGAPGLAAVLKQIVRSAREVLQADSAAIWSYDAGREKFILEGSIADGIPVEVWEQFRQEEPQRGQTGYTVMERRWVAVEDVDNTQQYPFLGESTRKLLEQIGARSFQGIALMVGEEKLGVLYVNYNRPRSFSEEEQKTAQTFANHAALALKKVKLLDQVNKARNAARVVAEVTVLENLQNTLNSIVKGTRDVLGCDVVTLYTYDQDREKLGFPPAMAGVKRPAKVLELGKVAERSVIHNILALDDLYVAEDTTTDSLMRGPFVEREGVLSSVGIPLIARHRKVGVMFVNYRHQHRFTADELTNIRLFAHQAAVAIRRAQLYEQVQKRAIALQALYEAGQVVISTLSLSEILNRIAEQARMLVDNPGTQTHILLVEGDKLKFINAYPPDVLLLLREQIGHEIDLKKGQNGRIGITGRVIETGESQLVGDIRKDVDYIGYTSETCSELAVPIRIGGKIIGVINVEHPDYNAFDAEDQHALESLAAQVAIAIQNAHLYEQVRQRAEQFQTLYQASLSLTAELSVEAVLQEVVHHARQLTGAQYGALGILSSEGKIKQLITSGLEAGGQEHIGTLPEGRGILGLLLSKPEPIRARDIRQHPGFTGFPRYHPQITSFLGVPIISKGAFTGNLFMANKLGAPEFSQEDQNVLELLAAQAAIAIDNARLFEETERHARLLKAAAQVARGATAILDMDELLSETVRLICDCFNFYHVGVFLLDDDHKYAILQAAYPKEGRGMLTRGHKLRVGKDGIVGFVTQTGKHHLAPDVKKDPYHLVNPELPLTRSEMVFPLIARSQVIGALDVQSNEIVNLSNEDIATLQTMADQLANAIHNAQLYQQATRRLEESNALQQVAVSLAGASELHEVLNLVMAEGMKLTKTEGGSFLLWDAQAREFAQTLRTDSEGKLRSYHSKVRTEGGLTRMIIEEQRPMVIPDTVEEPRINPGVIEQGYRASLGLPLVSQGQSIGVLYLRSREPRQFSERQVDLSEALASQAAVAIDRASRYEELKRTKGLVGARTAVAWMGMVSSAWRHTIEGHAITIREEIQQLRSDLPQQALDKIEGRLAKMERLTKMILDKPITPPLSEEEGVESVSINELLQERIRQLWENEPYKSVKLKLELKPSDSANVRASPEWLRRIFDVLVDNAAEAMAAVSNRVLTVSTQVTSDNKVEIVFADTGPGIPENILPRLFHEQIKMSKGTKGLGMGLLMAQTIAQTYDGEIRVEPIDPASTSIVVSLPIETGNAVIK